jgi:hypothetical protein
MQFDPDDPDGDMTTPIEAKLNLDDVGFRIIESGVQDLVRVLWQRGYKTIASCAGHKRELEPYPWVAISIDPADSQNLLEKLLNAVARFNMSLGENGRLPEALKTWVLVPLFTISGFAIYIQPYDNNPICDPDKISELRKTSRNLAHFIEQECADIFGANI